MSVQPNLMLNYSEVVRLAPIHTFFWEDKSATQGSERMCVFSVSRHFFKTNVTQSVTELIVKNTKLWSFSIKLGELRCKNVNNTFMIKRNFT